jgi:hypothetical protein
MEAAFSGVPELFGNKFYKSNVIDTLDNIKRMIEDNNFSLPHPKGINSELILNNGSWSEGQVYMAHT